MRQWRVTSDEHPLINDLRPKATHSQNIRAEAKRIFFSYSLPRSIVLPKRRIGVNLNNYCGKSI
jgi:hypothetical protein